MSEVIVLNEYLDQVAVIDTIFSMVWVERFLEVGEVTMDIPLGIVGIDHITPGNHLVTEESEYIMIIDDVNPVYDEESGDKLSVKGSSSESLLKSRVIQDPFYIDGDVQAAIFALLDDHLILPTKPERTIDNFSYLSNVDANGMVFTNLYDNGTIHDVISDICGGVDIGFRMFLDSNRILTFTLVVGKDRSHLQTVNPRVVFSDNYDNVFSSSYYLSTANYKNVMRVVTEDVDPSLKRVDTYIGMEPIGRDRREDFMSIQTPRETDGGPTLTVAETLDIINQKGIQELYNKRPFGVFDGDFDIYGAFKYGVDFSIGDLVLCVINGINVRARIIERVYSLAEDGITNRVAFDFDV